MSLPSTALAATPSRSSPPLRRSSRRPSTPSWKAYWLSAEPCSPSGRRTSTAPLPKLRTERLSPRVPGSPRRRRPNGAGTLNSDGYVTVGIAGRRCRRLHRLLMEIKLGRPLLPDEDVHHIDGDRQNNQFGNLQLLSHSEHTHRTKLVYPWLLYCFGCGRPFARHHQTRRTDTQLLLDRLRPTLQLPHPLAPCWQAPGPATRPHHSAGGTPGHHLPLCHKLMSPRRL